MDANREPVRLSDREKIALLRAALQDLRPKLAGMPDRWHIDQLLALTRG